MAGLSDTYENNVIDALLGAGFTKDATVYVALMNVSPTDSTFGTEVSGSGYARVAVTNNSTNWPAAASSQKKNGGTITFPTASGSWTTANAFALLNHASGTASSNVICYGNLGTPKTVNSGETCAFAGNALVISAD